MDSKRNAKRVNILDIYFIVIVRRTSMKKENIYKFSYASSILFIIGFFEKIVQGYNCFMKHKNQIIA